MNPMTHLHRKQVLAPAALLTMVWALAGCASLPSSAELDQQAAAAMKASFRDQGIAKVEFRQEGLTQLDGLRGQVDVAAAVNSLVLADAGELERALSAIRSCLRPGGHLVGIVPAMDAVHYLTMLLVDRALAAGKPLEAARKNAAHHADHACYDFAFGQFRYQGLEQHFWQPFEVSYRLGRAGFPKVRLGQVQLSWQQFGVGDDLKEQPPPWDWFFRAEPGE